MIDIILIIVLVVFTAVNLFVFKKVYDMDKKWEEEEQLK